MASHASTRTMQLYDRRADEVTLDEVERVLISRPNAKSASGGTRHEVRADRAAAG